MKPVACRPALAFGNVERSPAGIRPRTGAVAGFGRRLASPRVSRVPSECRRRQRIRLELLTRFLFGALVDADRLETARFYAQFEPGLTADDLECDGIPTLAARLDAAIDRMPPKGSPAVVSLRREVLAAGRAKAGDAPGRFSLTVPTGGGKTLSAMSFALNHAKRHGLRRVIVVIPYTSIIEQSARVYRGVLNDPAWPGVNNVLEHHSNLDEQKLRRTTPAPKTCASWPRKTGVRRSSSPPPCSSSNRSSPPTAAGAARCTTSPGASSCWTRSKRSATVPCAQIVDLLGQLTAGHGCSVVLSTATPPALKKREHSPLPGLTDVREIMDDPSALASAVRRLKIEWRTQTVTPYADLAVELRGHRQVLAIVHHRADARVVAEAVGDEALHLSALMCPAHRLSVIADVRNRLDDGKRCVLIATQLVEAGVDPGFSVVYRALAGLDSIAQSAGRCDREGKLTDAAGGAPRRPHGRFQGRNRPAAGRPDPGG